MQISKKGKAQENSKPLLETRLKKPRRREITVYGLGKPNGSNALAYLPQMALHLYKDITQAYPIPCLGKEEKVIDFFASKQSSRERNCSLHISILPESRLNG